MAFFCEGTRYRLACSPATPVKEVKERLVAGGITRAFGKAGQPGAYLSLFP
jgi:hypothetical protein